MAIEKVIYEKSYDSHENDDRVITALVKEKLYFKPEQVRVAQIKRKTSLGNHWREYDELYGIIGEARLTLEDIDTHEKQSYSLKTGDRVFIPAKVALRIEGKKGTIIIACSSEADREGKTHKYQIS